MEKFSLPACLQQAKRSALIALLLFSAAGGLRAQNRSFGLIYSENIKGSSTFFGNTLMNAVNAAGQPDITAMNGNSQTGTSSYSNGGTTNMQYVDIDGNSGVGAGTRNSSSADLVLPAGTNTIKMARLYWGGRAVTSQFDMTRVENRRIKIRKGVSGAYTEYTASQLDKHIESAGTASETWLYQAYVDITELVKQKGAGTYTVGNGAFSTGTGGDFGNYGAWSIVVVYENPTLSYNSVRIFDGYQQVYNGGTATTNTITLTGLNVPSGELASADAKLGIVAFEGDSKYNGDYFKINNQVLSNSLNPANNLWNSTITNNGVHVTTKSPNYTDQMGIDIDQFNVGMGYGIQPNASSVSLTFGTSLDQYFCGIISFVIKMKDPSIKLSKTVTDASNNGTAEVGETLTYKLKGWNIGVGNANAVVVMDSLPASVKFVPNSLKVNYCPGLGGGLKTDVANDDIADYTATTKTVTFRLGNSASGLKGGSLAMSDSFEVEFKAIVADPVGGVLMPVINIARLEATSDAAVNYVDDATAVINPVSTPLPVILTSFTATLIQPATVKLAWTSSMEINCSRYEVERSIDGVHFEKVATRAGSGNAATPTDYTLNDDITAVNASIIYYRLNQIDINGSSNLSDVVSVKVKRSIAGFTVAPNPFRSTFTVNIDWNKNETTVLKVYNMTGAEVLSKSVKLLNGNNQIVVNELASAAPGGYIIQFITDNGKIFKQVIKDK